MPYLPLICEIPIGPYNLRRPPNPVGILPSGNGPRLY